MIGITHSSDELTRLNQTRPLQTASLATFRGDALTDLLAGLAANSIGSFVNSAAGFSSRLVHDRHFDEAPNSPDSFSSGVCSIFGFYSPTLSFG